METSVNNKCKAFTSLEQSRKLAEILPIESADMYWFRQIDSDYYPPNVESIYPIPLFKDGKENFNYDIPCWSLASLLGVIPKRIKELNILQIGIDEKDFVIWYDGVGFGVNNGLPDITADNPVDACCELIIRLKELNLL